MREISKTRMNNLLQSLYASGLKLAYIVFAILAPIHSLMIATGCLIIIDLITGVWRAIKAKERVTSNKLRRTLSKIVSYQLCLITAFILETYIVQGVPFIKITAGLVSLTEGKSIFENLHKITGINILSSLKKFFNIDNIISKD